MSHWMMAIGMGLLTGGYTLWITSPAYQRRLPDASEFNRRLWTPEEEW